MRRLAEFIMRRRLNAVLFATVTSVVWVLFWPIAHLSAASIGLVALRLGMKQALGIVSGVSGLILILGLVSSAAMPLAVSLLMVMMMAFWIPALVLSAVLRKTASLAFTIQVAAIGYTVILLGFYGMVGSPYEWWKALLVPMSDFLQTQADFGQLGMDMDTAIDQVARVMTGVMAASLLFMAVFNLMIARWWQSLLYNAGGFAREFQSLRLGRGMAMVTMAMLLVGGFADIRWASDILFILGACFLLQGVAVFHAVAAKIDLHRVWLAGLYVLLLLIPQAMLLVAALGWVDSWADFRTRWAKKEND